MMKMPRGPRVEERKAKNEQGSSLRMRVSALLLRRLYAITPTSFEFFLFCFVPNLLLTA